MNLHMKLGLVLILATYTVADTPFYVPQITLKPLLGKVTNLGFALEQPQCIFQQYNTSDVWLVVALNNVVTSLSETNLSNPAKYSLFQTNNYYHIYQMPCNNFPCTDTAPKLSAIIPVGFETNCTDVPFCNGILTNKGPYRVKFVVLNNNNTMVKETRWSEQINLITGRNISTIKWPDEGHSAGMVIIVVLLSVLAAILLACLIAAIVLGSKDICWCRKIDNEGFLVQEEVDMSDYQPDIPYIPHSIYMTHSNRLSRRDNAIYTVYK
ncbi:uroplakin-3b-like protein 1 [Mixophyes fleayi]|uniref:uroplakin-3b-like protein 1 n=1 Tax=Mixophyes fleayi TaxID=3061075 RepID=UPI003F4E1032